MLLDHRTYTVRAGCLRKQMALYEKHGLAIQKKYFGEPLAWLSSYRRALELPAPIGGEIVAVNASLAARPGTVNMYPYSREGLVRIRPASSADLDALMDFGQYRAFVARLQDYDAWSRDRRMT